MFKHAKVQRTAIATAVSSLLVAHGGNAAAQSATEEGKIPEVIVTANRVAQPASKTPLALSVVSGDELKAK